MCTVLGLHRKGEYGSRTKSLEVRDDIKELRRNKVLELSSGVNPCGGQSLRLTAFNCSSMWTAVDAYVRECVHITCQYSGLHWLCFIIEVPKCTHTNTHILCGFLFLFFIFFVALTSDLYLQYLSNFNCFTNKKNGKINWVTLRTHYS